MIQLAISTEYLGMLMLKVRSLMAKEMAVMLDIGGNPIDDEGPLVLQETADDLTRDEIIAEIEGLSDEQQAELVALLWLGRGDGEPDEWRQLKRLASERRETPTGDYLLDHPLVAEDWAEGLVRLGYGSIVSGVGELH